MRTIVVFGLLLAVNTCVVAQDTPKVEIALGYTYARVNPSTSGVDNFSLNGGSAQFAGNLRPWFSVVGDFGAYKVGDINGASVDATLYTYMAGPRFSSYRSRVRTYAHVLLGGARVNNNPVAFSRNSFAMILGGGVDVKLNDAIAIRPGQFEYLMTRFDEGSGNTSQHALRFTTGIVFRFGKH